MKDSGTAKGCLWILLFVLVCTAWLYWEVRQQHRFASTVAANMAKMPGMRLVSSFKSGDIANPISWFWAPTTRLVYAAPDKSFPGASRFMTLSFGIDDAQAPDFVLVDVDCRMKKVAYYFPTDRESKGGDVARNVLGKPLIGPSGATFTRHDTKIPPDPQQLRAYCETDWTPESEAMRRR